MPVKNTVRAVVTRRFEAAPERVFDAWLKREWIERWMFGPAVRDEEIVRLALDPRVGGTFSFTVERDGELVEHLGKYLEIVRPWRLAFSWMVADASVGSRVLINIVPRGTGSELTLTQELHPSWADFVDRAQASWAGMLDALDAALA